MVQWREKLRDIKSQGTSGFTLDPTRPNNVGKRDTGIWGGFEFEAPKLTWMDEVIGGDWELESFGDDFFDEFAQ